MNASLIVAEELSQIEKSAKAGDFVRVENPGLANRELANRELTNRGLTNRYSNSVGIVLTIAIHVAVVLMLLSSRAKVEVGLPPIMAHVISDQSNRTESFEVPQTRPELNTPKVNMVVPDISIAESSTPVTMAIAAAPSSSVASTSQSSEKADMAEPRFDADYLNNPAPTYPRLSRRHREQGIVTLRVYVLASGSPERVELKTSSGFTLLDEAALEAVRRWKFIPAQTGGRATAAWVNVPIEFSLST